MLDGSIIKVHQDVMRSSYDKALEAIGRSVGGLSTKIHAKVDSLGQLVSILLTPGQVHESQVALGTCLLNLNPNLFARR